jgi:hypothetical protein
MTEPLQTPLDGTQQPAEVTPQEDLTESEQLQLEAQQRIENEAKELVEPGPNPEPPQQPAPQPQPERPAPQTPPATPSLDYEKKFSESSREAFVQMEGRKQAEARIDQLTNINITENELRSLYPDWDTMNDIEKRAFRETALANKKANQAMNIALDLAEQRAWETDFAKTLKANPALAGREEDFKAYCYKPAHKNVPIDVLVKSFLFDLPPAPTPAPRPTPGLERGSGGPRGGEGNGEYSDEQIAQIRVSDPKRYRQIIMNESRKERK